MYKKNEVKTYKKLEGVGELYFELTSWLLVVAELCGDTVQDEEGAGGRRREEKQAVHRVEDHTDQGQVKVSYSRSRVRIPHPWQNIQPIS